MAAPREPSGEIPPVRVSVRLKLVAFSAAVALLAGGGPAVWLILKSRAADRQRINTQLDQLGSTIASGGLFAGGAGDVDSRALKQFVGNAANLRLPLAYIVLVGPDGTVDVERSAASPEVLREIDPVLADVFGAKGGREEVFQRLAGTESLGAGHQSLWVSLVGEDKSTIGRLRVGMSTAEADRRAQQAFVTGGLLIGGLLLVALVFAVILTGPLARPLRRLADAMSLVAGGDLDQAIPDVKTKDEVGRLAAAFNVMTAGLRQRERLRGMLGRYISDEIAEKLISETDEMSFEGEMRQVTVLFLDMRDFSTMSEHQDPKVVFELLNGYFQIIVDSVTRNRGVINKFIGDAVMAVWGAPGHLPDPELKAISAAWEIQQRVATLNRQRELAGQVVVGVGIGINAGPAAAGNVGAEQRMEYTVIGHTVNMAQRFESAAGPGQILVPPAVYEAVRGKVQFRPLPPVKVKGRREPVSLFEVVGLGTSGQVNVG